MRAELSEAVPFSQYSDNCFKEKRRLTTTQSISIFIANLQCLTSDDV